MGHSQSYCQGWTGLNECCEERGHVPPGGGEKGEEALGNAWQRADLPNPTYGTCARLLDLYRSYVCDLFYVFAILRCCFLPAIIHIFQFVAVRFRSLCVTISPRVANVSTIGEGEDTRISRPGRSPKQPL